MRNASRSSHCFLLYALALGVGPQAQAATLSQAALRLPELLAELRATNPEMAERRHLLVAATARPSAVSQPQDPTLSLEWWQQPLDFKNYPLMLTARQALPWPGRLAVQRSLAENEIESAHDRVSDTQRRVETEMKRIYIELWLTERSLEVSESIHALLETVVGSANARYKAGTVTQVDVFKAQTELLTVENEGLDYQSTREQLHGRINELLDRSGHTTLGETDAGFARVTLPSEAVLVERVSASNPEIALAKDALREAESRAALAQKEDTPELAVWLGYMHNFGGVDSFTAGASTSLPIFSTRRKNALGQAAEAEVAARNDALRMATRATEAALHNALIQIDAAARHERLHVDKLIPLSEVALESALAGYRSGRLDFLAVLDAARMVRTHHLNHFRFLAEYELHIADLEMLLDHDFPRDGEHS